MKHLLLILGSLLLVNSAFADCIARAYCENEWIIAGHAGSVSPEAAAEIDAVPNAAKLVIDVQQNGQLNRYSQTFHTASFSEEFYIFESSYVKDQIQNNKEQHRANRLRCEAALRKYRNYPRCN